MKAHVNEHNQITLENGTVISIYGLDQNIKMFGYTLDPLTAAAPELLEAAEYCVSFLSAQHYPELTLRKRLQAAIAKAKGREP